MKTAFLSLFFLLFAFTTKLSLATDEPVLDLDGNELVPGKKYQILPLIVQGGGLALAKTGNQTHAASVIQQRSYNFNSGEAVVFTSVLERDNIIVDRPLEIRFGSQWVLVNDLKDGAWSVAIGSDEDHPGYTVTSGFFTIQKFSWSACTLYFKPLFGVTPSGDIGRKTDEDRNIRLALTPGEPWPVVFAKDSPEIERM